MNLIDNYPAIKNKKPSDILEEEDCVPLTKKEKILIWTCLLFAQIALGLIIYFAFIAG